MSADRTAVIGEGHLTVDGIVQTQRTRALLVLGASVIGAILGGLGAGLFTMSGQATVLAVCAGAAVLPILFWRAPGAAVALLVVFGAAFARYGDPESSVDFLANVPMWRSLNDAAGLSGIYVLPVEVVLVLALLVWIARDGAVRRLELPRTELSVSLAVLVAIALFAEIRGLAAHGDFKISLYELRPFLYLAAAYLLAAQGLRHRAAFQAVLWALVLGTAYRGLVGTDLAIKVANVYPRPNQLLEHDESFFFSLYLVLLVALWVFGMRGWLRRVATALMPFVLYADLSNNRRAAWAILPAGLLALAAVTWVRNPTRRRTIACALAVIFVVSTAYVVAFRYNTSTLAFPAHAIWSNFRPDPRDWSSNLYRQLEQFNLANDIRNSIVLGSGFGLPFSHVGLSFDASAFDPLVYYIPHNTVLWVWVKMGVVGMLAFWWAMGVAAVAAARLARHGDRDAALLATLGIAAVAGYFLLGWVDIGLAAVRVAVTVGCLLGAFEAAARATGLAPSMVLDEPGAAAVIRPEVITGRQAAASGVAGRL